MSNTGEARKIEPGGPNLASPAVTLISLIELNPTAMDGKERNEEKAGHQYLMKGDESPRMTRILRKIQFNLIDIAPAPVFAGLERPDDRVIGAVEVLPRMLVFGGIATTHVPAFQAQTQVDPDISHLQTLLAALRGAWRNAPNVIQMHTRDHKAPSSVTRQISMRKSKRDRSLSHGRGAAFYRSVANIAGHKDPGVLVSR
jgi:hypothetical protein